MSAPLENLPELRLGSAGKEFLIQTVLTVGLFLSITLVPLVGFFSGLLTPAPTVIAIIRWGVPNALLVPGCSALLGSLILYLLNLSDSIPYLVALIGMGALMGFGIRSGWSTQKTVGLASLFIIGVAGLFLILALTESKGELVQLIEQDMRGGISAAMEQLGSSSIETKELESKLLETVPLIVGILPGMFISCTVGMCWLNLLISRRYCHTAAGVPCVAEKLALWKSPEFFVWFVIAGGLMLILPEDDLKLAGLNLIIVVGTAYFLQGLAIVSFYFERWKLPFFVKGFVLAILFLQQFASMATAVLGLFDVWFDFRKLAKKPELDR
ncbi:conserved membrane hypothetical protein [Syntrophobacter sp. SbD1]|nr:conserved membrane hypothetical protein [Syntrophobacter sp. SbD1]